MANNGILNINKPQNMTSHDVVSVVRRTLGIKRVGHTGTLDPMATGVLPICVGKSTRIIEYLDLDIKAYRCTMIFGLETDTQDIWGEVVGKNSTDHLTEDKVRAAFKGFDGVIDQTPPMYSALKVNGKKLYEYAREGVSVEVKSRKVFIKSLVIEDISLDESKEKWVTFTVECSKGTYIRTICQDVGQILGCGGTLSCLERTKSGIFDIDSAISLDRLREMPRDEIDKLFLPSDYPLTHFGKVIIDESTAWMFVNGWHLPMEKCNIMLEPEYATKEFYLPIREEYKKAYNIYGTIGGMEEFLGVAFYNDTYKKLVADKVFYVRDSE